jgi:hypothetical protein
LQEDQMVMRGVGYREGRGAGDFELLFRIRAVPGEVVVGKEIKLAPRSRSPRRSSRSEND